MSKRKNTFTRFIEDIVDDTKDFVDDIIDRAKDLETDVRDTVKDVIDNDETATTQASSPDMADLQLALAELTRKVNQLTELQVASSVPAGSSASGSASTRRTAAA